MTDVTKEISATKPDFVDISNELWRRYDFGDDRTVLIDRPVKLNVKRKPDGDSHRVVDSQGIAHYIPAGWIHLSWAGKDGEAFSF
jgi:hypothetical protein